MKKIAFLLVVLFLSINNAFAGRINSKSVSEIYSREYNQKVIMHGYIEKHLHSDKYIFIDLTGEMIVQISQNILDDVNLSHYEDVYLYGVTSHINGKEKDFIRDNFGVVTTKIEITPSTPSQKYQKRTEFDRKYNNFVEKRQERVKLQKEKELAENNKKIALEKEEKRKNSIFYKFIKWFE